jgi:hypothetical protein
MKHILLLALVSIVFAGCSKSGDVTPNGNKSSGDASKIPGGPSQTPPDTTPKLTHDDSIHMASFKIGTQMVKTSVSGSKLILVFDENVDLLFSQEGYLKISAVHLKEGFDKTMLAGIDYSTVAEGGNTTYDWVDDNLNNVILKTVTDTVVNKAKMVKINVHRPFTFSKQYASNKAALSGQSQFISKTNDTVTFSSYTYYNEKNYQPRSAAAVLVYTE